MSRANGERVKMQSQDIHRSASVEAFGATNQRILIVDDEPNVRLAYRVTLEAEGVAVEQANGAAQALDKLANKNFDLAILDLRMPEMDGLDLLEEMRKRGNHTPAVMITAYGDVPSAVRAMKLGAIDFLEKPLTPEALRAITLEVFGRHRATPSTTRPVAQEDTFEAHFSEAKRLINLQSFGSAWTHLARALELGPRSAEALNLAGVLFEMQGDYGRAAKLYGKAIESMPGYTPAQKNMRRLVDLHDSGGSKEDIHLGD